jgi:5-bromo-4-chloroindolyl phosphate hydrolysis protein
MGLLKLTKDLFAIKEPPPAPEKSEEQEVKREKLSYQEYGLHQASMLGGSTPGLRVCLQKVYFDFKDRIKDDHEKQEDLKRPARIKLEEHKGNSERWENKMKKIKEEDIPRYKQRIETLKEEKSHIRKNPQEIIGDQTGRPSFIIGAVILTFLTVYLFVFYSSASYSAFFKEFTQNEIGVANSIFDAQAISKAIKDGVTELVLILTIPFVFLGLGYLIHKLQEEKGFQKFIKIAALVLVTFAFDGILAYEITEKIYNIKKGNSFAGMAEFSVPLALRSINFWLIIFAGFIVYLIWGFVFDFVMAAYGKIDKVKVALKEKDRMIEDTTKQISELNEEIDKIGHQVDHAKTEIKKLSETVNSVIIPREFELEAFSFMSGWLAWMKGNGRPHSDQEAAEAIVQEFVSVAVYNYPKINNG